MAKVSALDGAQASKSTETNAAGMYQITGIAGGTVTLSASALGYQTVERTVIVDGDTTVDFVLPRIAQSPVPALAGTWGARMEWVSWGIVGHAWLAEFKLNQTGRSVSGTWWVPVSDWRGTITGTIESDRSFIGRMAIHRPCETSGALKWGLLDYQERTLTVSLWFDDRTCMPDDYTFILDRRCRVTDIPSLACE